MVLLELPQHQLSPNIHGYGEVAIVLGDSTEVVQHLECAVLLAVLLSKYGPYQTQL